MADARTGTTEEQTSGQPEPADVKMPSWRWLWRATWLVVGVVFLALLGYNILRATQGLLTLIFTALFLSFALEPAVGWLAAKGMRRGLATFLILFILGIAGLAMLALMVPVIVKQLQELIKQAPAILDQVSRFTDRWLGFELDVAKIQDSLTNANLDVGQYASNVAGTVLGAGAAIVGSLFRLLTIALFTFYFVADGPRFRRAVCSLLDESRQRRVLWTWEVAIDKSGAYLYSRLLLATFSGIATFIVLTALGIPFAVPLSVWMGIVSQFIPTVGTYIAMALPLLVAVVENRFDALILLIFFTVYQQVENYLISPRVTSRTMELHPAVAFGAAIAGASVAGVVGALLALPAAAIVQSVVSTYVHRHDVMDTDLTREAEAVTTAAGTEPKPQKSRERMRSLKAISERFRRGA